MTRLYLAEGLPCSGKSTVSKYVAERLAETGVNVVCTDEGSGSHPADYEFHAFADEACLAALPEDLQEKIRTKGEAVPGGFVMPLEGLDRSAFDALLVRKIYDFLPWETEKPLMLNKWETFVEEALQDPEDTVYVFNCVFLQNPMCETMMRFGFPEEESGNYIVEIARRIAPLEPVVLYLKNDDIAESVKAAAGERPGWLSQVIDYHCGGAYGKRMGAEGFEGYIACLAERQRRELRILSDLPVRSLVLDNPQRDWEKARGQIGEFLQTVNGT